MSKLWNSHRLQFSNGQQCIFNGPGCTEDAEQQDHTLHKRRGGAKAKASGLSLHLDSIYNCGPACKVCNVVTKFCDTQKGKERGMDWLVNRHGIDNLAEWAGEFPEYMKFEGSEWWEMTMRLTQYRGLE